MGANDVCINLTSSFPAVSGLNIKELLLELSHFFLRSILIAEVI